MQISNQTVFFKYGNVNGTICNILNSAALMLASICKGAAMGYKISSVANTEKYIGATTGALLGLTASLMYLNFSWCSLKSHKCQVNSHIQNVTLKLENTLRLKKQFVDLKKLLWYNSTPAFLKKYKEPCKKNNLKCKEITDLKTATKEYKKYFNHLSKCLTYYLATLSIVNTTDDYFNNMHIIDYKLYTKDKLYNALNAINDFIAKGENNLHERDTLAACLEYSLTITDIEVIKILLEKCPETPKKTLTDFCCEQENNLKSLYYIIILNKQIKKIFIIKCLIKTIALLIAYKKL